MDEFKRRDFLKTTAGVAASTALGGGSALFAADAYAQYKAKPEKGAKLRVLRWKRFVQGDEDVFVANTAKFTQLTGVEVRVDAEDWEDVRPKAAVAANVGSRSRHHHQHDGGRRISIPDKLRRRHRLGRIPRAEVRRLVRDRAGLRHGRQGAGSRSRWAPPATRWCYRKSMLNAAGFKEFPNGHDRAFSSCARR